MATDRGTEIYEIKRKRSNRLVPIILTIIFIFFAGVVWPISFYFEGSGPIYEREFSNFGITLVLILVGIVSYMLYVTFWLYYQPYLFKIYERGILLTKRYEADNIPPPHTREDVVKIKHDRRLMVQDHFIPIADVAHIYVFLTTEQRFEKDSYIVIIERSGRWYMFGFPQAIDLNVILDNFGKSFSGRWNRVFGGIH